jgi:histidinol phosphatase-like PHP family hydrolase
MKSDSEQLLELRTSIILKHLDGQPENVKQSAIKNLHRMSFTDHADFLEYVADMYSINPPKAKSEEVTEEQLDLIMENMGIPPLRKSSASAKSKEDKDLDEIMKYL